MNWLKEAVVSQEGFIERKNASLETAQAEAARRDLDLGDRIAAIQQKSELKAEQMREMGYVDILEDVRNTFFPDSHIQEAEYIAGNINFRSSEGSLNERLREVRGLDRDQWANGINDDDIGASFNLGYLWEGTRLVSHDGVYEQVSVSAWKTEFKLSIVGSKVTVWGKNVPKTEFEEIPSADELKGFINASIKNHYDKR